MRFWVRVLNILDWRCAPLHSSSSNTPHVLLAPSFFIIIDVTSSYPHPPDGPQCRCSLFLQTARDITQIQTQFSFLLILGYQILIATPSTGSYHFYYAYNAKQKCRTKCKFLSLYPVLGAILFTMLTMRNKNTEQNVGRDWILRSILKSNDVLPLDADTCTARKTWPMCCCP